MEVDLLPVQDVGSPDEHRAVLIGSAVNHGKWLPGVVDFIRETNRRSTGSQ